MPDDTDDLDPQQPVVESTGSAAPSPPPPAAGPSPSGPYSRPAGPPGWHPAWPPPPTPTTPQHPPVRQPQQPQPQPQQPPFGGQGWGYPGHQPPRRGGAVWPLAVAALVLGLVGGAIGAGIVTSAHDDGADGPSVVAPDITSSGPVPGGAKANPVIKVANEVLPSVVSIDVRGKSEEVTGSGFVYDRSGLVVTNNHVIEPAVEKGDIRVILPDGTVRAADIIGRSPSYDIAVIKLDNPDGLVPATLGRSDPVRVGESVVAIGSPLGLNATVTSGIISATHRPVTAGGSGETSYLNALQTDAAINPGNSGGPLVDLDGFVIGVNSAIATLGSAGGGQSGSIGVGFSIPIDQVKHTVDEIIATGHAEYPVIGAQVSLARSLDGARIEDVVNASPADDAGLQVGDLITAVEGDHIADGVELIVTIRSFEPGDVVAMTVDRDGDDRQVRLTLGKQVG